MGVEKIGENKYKGEETGTESDEIKRIEAIGADGAAWRRWGRLCGSILSLKRAAANLQCKRRRAADGGRGN